MKRFATQAEISGAPILAVSLPASAHESDTISRGERPEVYSSADLKKFEGKGSLRTAEFERRLVALFWRTGQAVPFLFRTGDGQLRSLDAGCLGYLAHRKVPDVDLVEEKDVVIAAIPTESLLARLERIRPSVEATVHDEE